ncbi:RHS repeat-associated core domain-containing protein, partial [Fretibacterium sp. OH1220_COT-178]|uniref:RHS repeat-associated core domain-containing protein n=1 Tax=Fretibacterium sp. OH1220_COT-178 TaxID=2491047 RepID=UPI0013150E1C
FDRTTELYQLRARYMDPRTGTFLSLDPHQGNRHDPQSLHKYMYAHANPATNTDPTGLWSLGEMGGAMAGQSILAGSSGLNFWVVLGMLVPRAKEIVGATIALSLLTERYMDAALNGDIRFVELLSVLTRAILDTLTASNKAANSIVFSQSLFSPEEIKGAIDKLKTDHKKVEHIQDEKHLWKNRLNLDPKDPKDWEEIILIIQAVLASGTEEKYGVALKRSLEVGKEIVSVTYTIIDGVIRISDAWVKY